MTKQNLDLIQTLESPYKDCKSIHADNSHILEASCISSVVEEVISNSFVISVFDFSRTPEAVACWRSFGTAALGQR